MIRRPPRSTHCISSAASDVYKRQLFTFLLHFAQPNTKDRRCGGGLHELFGECRAKALRCPWLFCARCCPAVSAMFAPPLPPIPRLPSRSSLVQDLVCRWLF
eukprot:TRINITY_DN11808_c0_g1_i4.p2 TRINITY_DN11808_c0_g1~~TRINITY_DN11808_c0_g1_i4.p2  ORF type:complete len:109 (+),score=16.22 TRINITY_DN11808_c0_g1_i4:24-329(+)